MSKSLSIFFILLPNIILGGCNYSLTSVAREDSDVLRVNRPYRLKPTCLMEPPTRIEKVELVNIENQATRTLEPVFNAEGLYWTPSDELSGRYRFRFTCGGKRCYSPVFVVDGALNDAGKPIHYPKEDTSSLR